VVWFWMSVFILLLLAVGRRATGEPLYGSKSRMIMLGFLNGRIGTLILLWVPAGLLLFIAIQAISSSYFYTITGAAISALYAGLTSSVLAFIALGVGVPVCFIFYVVSG